MAPALVAKRDGPVLWRIPGGMVGSILILIPALVYLELFDLAAQPGGLLYIGTFVVILAVEAVILVGSRTGRPGRYRR